MTYLLRVPCCEVSVVYADTLSVVLFCVFVHACFLFIIRVGGKPELKSMCVIISELSFAPYQSTLMGIWFYYESAKTQKMQSLVPSQRDPNTSSNLSSCFIYSIKWVIKQPCLRLEEINVYKYFTFKNVCSVDINFFFFLFLHKCQKLQEAEFAAFIFIE